MSYSIMKYKYYANHSEALGLTVSPTIMQVRQLRVISLTKVAMQKLIIFPAFEPHFPSIKHIVFNGRHASSGCF